MHWMNVTYPKSRNPSGGLPHECHGSDKFGDSCEAEQGAAYVYFHKSIRKVAIDISFAEKEVA